MDDAESGGVQPEGGLRISELISYLRFTFYTDITRYLCGVDNRKILWNLSSR